MDRDSIITLLKSFYFGSLDNNPPLVYMYAVVKAYLREKGYEESRIDAALKYLTLTALIYDATMAVAEYYERKFNIYKLWSAPNPLSNQGQERKVILIF